MTRPRRQRLALWQRKRLHPSDEPIRWLTTLNWQNRNSTPEGESNFLIAPETRGEVLAHHRCKRLASSKGSLNFGLPKLGGLDIIVRDKTVNAKVAQR